MTRGEEYLNNLLEEYRKSFDVYTDYEIGGKMAAAYGYYSAVSEKYVLSPKANLWSVHGYEHILFFLKDTITERDIEEARELMSMHMAPELVCKGNKYPEKDHMNSYLTVAFICDRTPEESVLKALRGFKYEKNYLLTIRGYVQGHMVLMDLSKGTATTNRAAKHLAAFYQKVFGAKRA